MKKFLALAVLATATSSFAATDRAIYDIMYLPKAGTAFGLTDFAGLSRTLEDKDDDKTELSGFAVNQTLGYSITDRFALAGSLSYGDYEVDPDGGDKYTIDGFSDPTITAKFRVMEEEYTLDLIGALKISVGDSEVETDGDTDNLQGGHVLDLGVQFGKKTETFQWAVSGTYTRNFERTYDYEGAGNGDVDFDANNEIEFRGDILNKLAEKSFLRSHLAVSFSDELETDDGDSFESPTTDYTIGTEYQHLIDANLLLRAGIAFTMSNHDSGQLDSDNAAVVNFGATYQF